MKLVILIVVLAISQTYAASREVNNWFKLKKLFFSDDAAFGCKAGDRGVTCRDCTTLLVCESGKTRSCQSVEPSKPYCNPITKQCESESTCPQSLSKPMVCQYKGFFPDPLACNRFWYCKGKEADPQSYACPTGYKFDASRKICANTTVCLSFSSETKTGLCRGNIFKYVVHPMDLNLYMFCDDENQLKSCSNAHSIYNVAKGECISTCKSEGFIADSLPDKFNICVKEGNSLKAYPMSCATKTIFDEKEGFCVPDPNAVDLNTATPTGPLTTTNDPNAG